MANRFELLALDVDGTLVDESGEISPRLRRALAAARAQGVRICLCTGRPLAATWDYWQQLDPATPPVVFNGALVPAVDGGAPLVRRPLPARAVAPLVAESRAHGDHLELHTAEHCYVEQMGPEGRWQREKLGIEPVVGSFDMLPAGVELLKGQVVILPEKRARWEAFGPALAPDAILSWGVSPAFAGHFINVMAAGVEKDTALDAVLATVGIPWERVLAAGDSPSDLGYVRRAGCGVILGNASAAVRAQAPYVAPPVAEDGLAQAVERWVLN